MTPQHTAIVDKLKAGMDPLEICLELGCGMAEVTMLAGKYKIAPRPAPGEQRKGRPKEADKHHYMMAVLDKASTEKILRPLPAQFETTGPDGKKLVLQLPTVTTRSPS